MKKLVSVLLTMVILFSFPLSAYASEADTIQTQEIQMIVLDDNTEIWQPKTRWANVSIITMSIKSSGGNVTVSYDVQGYFPENTIKVTCNLQGLYNANWQTVKSQSKSSKFYCMSSFTGRVDQNTYTRMILNITVLDKNGRTIESFVAHSQAYTVY